MSRFDVRIEMMLGDTWTDITGKVYQRDPITITRGRANESDRVDPADCAITLDNRTGDFSPRNPLGQYYGQLGRNTPLRVVAGTPTIAAGSSVTDGSTSHVAPSINAVTDTGLLIGTWISGQSPGSYATPGGMTAGTETDGASSTARAATKTLSAAGATGTQTATFTGTVTGHAQAAIVVPGDDVAPVVEEAVVDQQLSTVTTATASVFTGDTTEDGWWLVAVQMWNQDPLNQMPLLPTGTPGRWSRLLDTGAGTAPRIKAWARRIDVPGSQRVDFETPLTTVTVDNHVRVFVVSNVRYSSIRVVGEVSAWPPRWDTSGNDVYVPIQVAGILRRLTQGVKPLRSAVYRFATGQKPPPVGYWPCEDQAGALRLATPIARQPALALLAGTPELAGFEDFVASDPLLTLKDAKFACDVTGYTSTGSTRLQWLMQFAEGGTDVGDNKVLLRLDCTGSVSRVEVNHSTTETLQILLYRTHPDDESANAGKIELIGSVTKTFTGNLFGALLRCSLELTESGGNIHYELKIQRVGATTTTDTESSDLLNHSIGVVRGLTLNPGRGIGDVAVGHFLLRPDFDDVFDLDNVVQGYVGEKAGRRIERLCAEEGINFTGIGPLDETVDMGAQRSATLVDLVGECADADGGILHETREELGLTYRTRWTLYNQGLAIPETASEGVVAGPGSPGIPGGGGGGGGGGSGVQTTKTYVSDFARSFNSSGSMRGGSQAPLYQGQNNSNIGGHGNQKSWIWFDWTTIWADLAGSTIQKFELWMYADHWWFDSGGTAIIGYHRANHRDTYDDTLDDIDIKRSGDWPKPGGRWVDLTGTGIDNAFLIGVAKGIAVGPAPSTSLEYYGYFEPPQDSDGSTNSRAPKLRVTYTPP